jgi:tetraacyldisaccharide 4'-kinase
VKIPSALRVGLWPVSLIWSGAVRLRAAGYRRGLLRKRRLPGVVISVGNLTAGGTGKTPMVLWLAKRLRAEGKRVGILTRGYRSRPDAPAGAPQSDEVAIYRERLGHHVELGVGADRYATGTTLAHHGVEWFILDDGFQHMQLERDANIVLLDASNPFGGGMLLPAGLLREPKSALGRADVIVISRNNHAPAVEAMVRRFTDAPIYYATTDLREVVGLAKVPTGELLSLSEDNFRRRKAFAFCGIGNPQAFFEDLRRWGASLAGCESFPDHHSFTPHDVQRLEAMAQESGAEFMVCTEKDVFNLGAMQIKKLPAYFVRIDLCMNDADGFWKTVRETIERRHRTAGA